MAPQLFSRRHETNRPEAGLLYDEVPSRVRSGFMNILQELTGVNPNELGARLVKEICKAMDLPSLGIRLNKLVEALPWDEFCDLCEVTYNILKNSGSHESFETKLNELFNRRYFGYEMRTGEMQRAGAHAQDAAIAEARGILRDDDLKGPDEQFQKAIGFYNRRPNPDNENAVKEAVSAVEGVAQILLGDTSLTLSKALSRLEKEQDVHPTLIVMLEKLYAYRSDAEGVAHALTGDKEVRPEDAEFALAVSASAIVYLARLYGRGVE